MLVKEFERSGIHDLFKAMSKFYTVTCQAKELYEEAKTAKEKAKELNNEILLKKGEVIKLTDDFNYLQASETKLKDEVEELKVDAIEKELTLPTWRDKFQSLPHPWRKHVKKLLQLSRNQESIRLV
nr:uncharacterized protein LOC112004117 [Quercus suber]